jgi:hypothetical protein
LGSGSSGFISYRRRPGGCRSQLVSYSRRPGDSFRGLSYDGRLLRDSGGLRGDSRGLNCDDGGFANGSLGLSSNKN